MSLRKRYGFYGKRNVLQCVIFIVVCVLLAVLLVCGASYARFATGENVRSDSAIASWSVKINVGDILKDGESGTSVSSGEISVTENGEKIKPGQTGYFDIIIDPTGAQVAFSYTVLVSKDSKLPSGMSINGYADGVVELPQSGAYTRDDCVTVRFYWEWADVDFDQYAEYDFKISVSARQYSGQENGEALGL